MNNGAVDAKFEMQGTCPMCGIKLTFRWQTDDIPYFGEVMHLGMSCQCGFKHADTLILSERDPVRYELKVSSPDDINARVVRSTSGTIRVPELGVDIEPGLQSESFVTNIEGILDRIENIVQMNKKWAEDESQLIRIDEILRTIRDVKSGRTHITVIIEDPVGNSAIISERATRRKLTRKEAEGLKTGMIAV